MKRGYKFIILAFMIYFVDILYHYMPCHNPDSHIFCKLQWRTRGIFSGRGVQQIQLRTEDRENGHLGVVAPLSGVLEAAVIWYKKFHFI